MPGLEEDLPSADEPRVADRVRQWLESAGFGLELRVARAFYYLPDGVRVGALRVEPSMSYLDQTTNKWREIDVVAVAHSRRDNNRRIQVVAECKSGNTKPWVVLVDPLRGRDNPEEAYLHALMHWSGSVDPWEAWRNLRGTLCVPRDPRGYAITEGLRGGEKSREDDAGPNVPFRAVRQAMAAARHLRDKIEPLDGDVMQLTIPIVVTGAKLFECGIDQTGTIEVLAVDHSALRLQPDSNAPPIDVQVMSEKYLVDVWAPALAQVIGDL